MANKRKLRLPSQGKVKREDFLVEGHLVETQHREPLETSDQTELFPDARSSDPNGTGIEVPASAKYDSEGGVKDE